METGLYLPPVGDARSPQLVQARLAAFQPTLENKGVSSEEEASMRTKAVRDMASLFIYQLIREMRKTVPRSGLFDGGHAQDIYEQMMDERLADVIASTGQLGLTRMIENEVLKYR